MLIEDADYPRMRLHPIEGECSSPRPVLLYAYFCVVRCILYLITCNEFLVTKLAFMCVHRYMSTTMVSDHSGVEHRVVFFR
jgi:hypothetical protein